MPEGFFGQARPFWQASLPYGKENERSLPEKAPGKSCSMVVHTGSKTKSIFRLSFKPDFFIVNALEKKPMLLFNTAA